MAGRISQDVVEAETVATPAARVSQDVVEAEVVATPAVRVSQDVLEAESVATPKVRISQDVLEGHVVATPRVRLSQIVLEILVPNIGVFMPIVYPDLPGQPGYSSFWVPGFFNLTQKMGSGATLDLGIAEQPLHDFELTYEVLRDTFKPGSTEFRTMMGFFGALGGNLGRFLYRNPDDYSVTSQIIATTDGVEHLFTLVRTFGLIGSEYSWTENIGYVDLTVPLTLYLDGVPQDASTYSVLQTQPGLQQIDFMATPTTGQVITVDMNYFYYCRLPDSTLTFEKFMKQLWTLKKIKFSSCRANT